jgi:RING finger/CHY zinc finger protein 1
MDDEAIMQKIKDRMLYEKYAKKRVNIRKSYDSDTDRSDDEESRTEAKQDYNITEKLKEKINEKYSCLHYKSHCSIKALCCNKIYPCQKCHDDKNIDHQIHVNKQNIICNKCDLEQKITNICNNCDTQFGKYFCSKCNIFSNEENIKHCDKCKTCVTNNIEYKHCNLCKCCVYKNDNHECRDDIDKEKCCVCLREFASTKIISLNCKHVLHYDCYTELIKNSKKCPICTKKII